MPGLSGPTKTSLNISGIRRYSWIGKQGTASKTTRCTCPSSFGRKVNVEPRSPISKPSKVTPNAIDVSWSCQRRPEPLLRASPPSGRRIILGGHPPVDGGDVSINGRPTPSASVRRHRDGARWGSDEGSRGSDPRPLGLTMGGLLDRTLGSDPVHQGSRLP